MRVQLKPSLSFLFASLFVLGCVKSEVTTIGDPMPPLAEGCPVAVFPATTPNYQWKDIASAQATCSNMAGRTTCIERLKKDTCEAGGDTLYGFVEGRQRDAIIVTATIAHRTGAPVAVSGPTPPGSPATPPAGQPQLAAETCSPPCSPGYQCQATTCVAQCNPTCSAGSHCANDRTCQPDKPAAAK